MSAQFPRLALGDTLVDDGPEPLLRGWDGSPIGRSFAVEAQRAQPRYRVRFPWMGLAAVSGGLGGAVVGFAAALRLAGIGG